MSSHKANCKWTVSFSATSQIHFIGNLLSSSQEIGFSPCVRLQLWMRFALLLCWLDPPAGLIAVWSPRPVATCQRCSSHIHCSAPAASDKIPFVSFSLTAILSCSYYGPDFFFFLFCVYSLATHHPTVPMTVDRWLVDAGKRTCSWSLPKMLFCRWIKCETRTRMQKKKRKKNSDSECCEIYFFSSTLLPESVLPHYSGWALRDTPHVCLDQTSDRTHDRVFCSQCDRHFFVPLVLSTESAPKQWE